MIAIMATLLYMTVWVVRLLYHIIVKAIKIRVKTDDNPILKYSLATLIYPLFLLGALIASAFWVASIFNLKTWLKNILLAPFIDIPNVCRISAINLITIFVLGIIVNFCVGLVKRLYLTRGSDRYALGKKAVAISMLSIIAWFIYAVIVIVALHINHTGIIAAIGGASLGLGFALRDTIENFFYGLTMMTGRARPIYIGGMVFAAIVRNVCDYATHIPVPMKQIDVIGEVCLSLFLALAMVSLRLWELAELALPLIIMLAVQLLLMAIFAYHIIFRAMGSDYDAAVITSGFFGFCLGATPNAMANMQAVCRTYSPSVKAYLLIPIVGSIFTDFINSTIITVFINIL